MVTMGRGVLEFLGLCNLIVVDVAEEVCFQRTNGLGFEISWLQELFLRQSNLKLRFCKIIEFFDVFAGF